MDIVILYFELDLEILFILERVLIDVAAGRLTMQAHDKIEVFDVYQALKLYIVYKELSTITVIDAELVVHQVEVKDPLLKVLLN